MSHPILTVEDVSKTYDGFKAISNLNFYLFEGELRTVGRHLVIAEDVHRAFALLRREDEVGAEAQHPSSVEQLGVERLRMQCAEVAQAELME